MDFIQVDVFADDAYAGNPLAVFPDASGLSAAQMQAIAREMNLSETAFVTECEPDSYKVRIFTPAQEVAFAGHPTIGTAWVLRDAGRLTDDEVVQRSGAGATTVRFEPGRAWFRRAGTAEPDLKQRDPDVASKLARALGIHHEEIGLEARELGRAGRLRPAFSSAGLRQLMIPLRDAGAVAKCRVPYDLADLAPEGVYCFTATQAGRMRARGLFPGLGVHEDPATGSAAAALGLYVADRTGPMEFEIVQGVELHRPSRIFVRAEPGAVQVGGSCFPVLTGTLRKLP